MATSAYLVLVTAPPEAAGELARRLVEERLAACVNRVPGLRSVYRWEGRVEEDEEVLLLIKTPADRLEALKKRVPELHPYRVPEVLALPVADGHPPYLAWLVEATRFS